MLGCRGQGCLQFQVCGWEAGGTRLALRWCCLPALLPRESSVLACGFASSGWVLGMPAECLRLAGQTEAVFTGPTMASRPAGEGQRAV